MVKARLVDIRDTKSSSGNILESDIGDLRVRAMHNITGKQKIEALRLQIISAVSDVLLVHIDERELEKRKLKKINEDRLSHTDDSLWQE